MTDQSSENSQETLSFGQWIQKQRLNRNISLEEIAAVTKVHISQLKHLESDEREKLPAPAFVRGFLVSYARHLDLDEDEVLKRFKGPETASGHTDFFGRITRAAQNPTPSKVRIVENSPLSQAPGSKDMDRPLPPIFRTRNLLFLFGAVLLVGGFAALISLGKRNKAQQALPPTTPPPSAAATTSPEPTATPTENAAVSPPTTDKSAAEKSAPKSPSTPTATAAPEAPATPPPVPEGKKYKLELHSLEQSWVNIRVDDEESKGMVLNTHSNSSFEADRRISLSLSDAGAVEIRWNGTWYSAPGFRGDVKSLTLPDQLAKLTPRPPKPRKAPKPEAAAAPTPTPPPAATTESTPPPAQE